MFVSGFNTHPNAGGVFAAFDGSPSAPIASEVSRVNVLMEMQSLILFPT